MLKIRRTPFAHLCLASSLALACSSGAESSETKPDAVPAETPAASGDEAAASEAGEDDAEDPMSARRPDPHSFSRPDQVRVVHMGLDWSIDFERKQLSGEVSMLVERLDPKAPLILDDRGLEILGVDTAAGTLDEGPEGVPALALRETPVEWKQTTYELGQAEEGLGRPLTIQLPEGHALVRVRYHTTDAASGLQWLEPAQTTGKKHPFLYSQSQAIHARSWIPCQDSPGVRVTFDATVQVAAPYTAVMAANMLDGLDPKVEGEADSERRSFRFVMPQRVPSYLIALGAGDLAKGVLSERAAVWADPTVVPAATDEFADVEKMIVAAEALYGPYRWGRYDLLVLPPAFPFGGMENPRLTFATPTILAGDRSLVSLVAHELAHSWSGNLVTNSTWEDLWLNEGFTVYFERRIVEAIYGKERAEMEATLGRQDLDEELTQNLADRPDDQKLHADLEGRDPDDYFSSVPYEKGAFFLEALERTYGREVFDAFLRGWFDQNAFGSVDTAKFRAYLQAELIGKHQPLEGQKVPDVELWIEGPGLPEDAPNPKSPAFAAVDAQVKAFSSGKKPAAGLSTKSWTPYEWLHFLRALPADLDVAKMAELDTAFKLTASGNSEIVSEWLGLAATTRYEKAFPRIEEFLTTVGRRKFLTPLYKALLSSEDGKKQALAIYAKARPGYHAISTRTLDELLGYQP